VVVGAVERLDAPALDRLGDDRDGLVGRDGREGGEDLVPVVPVDDLDLEAEGGGLGGERLGRLLGGDLLALAPLASQIWPSRLSPSPTTT
jgi:hypothetical protein